MNSTSGSSPRRALTIIDVLATVVALAVLLSLVLPALARGAGESGIVVSLNNLRAMNTAYAAYAGDFNDRQPTAIVDDFSTYGSTGPAAIIGYNAVHGEDHPSILLGECGGGMWGFYVGPEFGTAGNWITLTPIVFPTASGSGFGFFRIPNSVQFHTYVGNGFYRSPFYAPNDVGTYSTVACWFDHECGYLSSAHTGGQRWSSYCTSPAAQFDPGVMRSTSAGGFQDPFSFAEGFRSPSVSQAKHPELKTRMLEHFWNQNVPDDRCNTFLSSGSIDGCEPWTFNQGAASEPATLFYDGSVRLLPNAEVLAADAVILKQTGDGLWNRGTSFGATGYRGDQSYDGTILSHHILTNDGILGRDTIATRP